MRTRVALATLLAGRLCGAPAPVEAPPVSRPAFVMPTPVQRASPPGLAPLEAVVVTVRLDPSEPWAAKEPVAEDDSDVNALLTPDPALWPDRPSAQGLLFALTCSDDAPGCDDDGEAWLQVVEAEGLRDGPPSAHDDEWDRYVALWALYAETSLFSDGVSELADEVHEAYLRTPDGPTTGALAFARLLLADDLEDLTDARDLAYDLLADDTPGLRHMGLEVLGALDDTTVAELDALLLPPEDEPRRLRAALAMAVQRGTPEEASALAEALAIHPLATDADRTDAIDASLLATAPTAPWLTALTQEVRLCADVFPGEVVPIDVRAGVWTVLGDGPAADCLVGWQPGNSPDMALDLRLTR